VADPKILKRAADNVSAPSSFTANTHNKQYAFLYGKRRLIDRNYEPIGVGRPHPLNPQLVLGIQRNPHEKTLLQILLLSIVTVTLSLDVVLPKNIDGRAAIYILWYFSVRYDM